MDVLYEKSLYIRAKLNSYFILVSEFLKGLTYPLHFIDFKIYWCLVGVMSYDRWPKSRAETTNQNLDFYDLMSLS